MSSESSEELSRPVGFAEGFFLELAGGGEGEQDVREPEEALESVIGGIEPTVSTDGRWAAGREEGVSGLEERKGWERAGSR